MPPIKLSKKEARQLALNAQFCFLSQRSTSSSNLSTDTSLQTIAHLGHVQIDSISVIQRAHHHIMWTRNHDYRPEHLDDLQQHPRKIFEYWSHAASYLPMDQYRFCLPRMRRLKNDDFSWWFPKDKRMMRYVLDRVKREGPMESRDFRDPKHKPGPWWGWKPAKIALEHLFMQGTLMVVKRENFRKVYDLAERVLPADTVTRMPTPTQMATFLVEKTVRALGIVSVKDMVYGRQEGKEKIEAVVAGKIKKKELHEVRIEGVGETYYVDRVNLEAFPVRKHAPELYILSPFDNFVIIRRRLQELFDFDYQLECYVPAGKRKFGYFSLPVSYDDEIVGVVDLKAERKMRELVVRNLHIQKETKELDAFWELFSRKLRLFAGFNGCDTLRSETEVPYRYQVLIQ